MWANLGWVVWLDIIDLWSISKKVTLVLECWRCFQNMEEQRSKDYLGGCLLREEWSRERKNTIIKGQRIM